MPALAKPMLVNTSPYLVAKFATTTARGPHLFCASATPESASQRPAIRGKGCAPGGSFG
jgi:hypothetical protein